jgi:HAD superfamily phosphoserine phosphatase-like hydrolase
MMGTCIFDVDSTLLRCESLELILKKKLSVANFKKFQEITQLGLRGEISFNESLKKRLQLACPTLQDVQEFALTLRQFLTPGFKELIDELKNNGHQIWLVSGAIKETLLPLAPLLKIPLERIIAVKVVWTLTGDFKSLDPQDPNSVSKVFGAKPHALLWPKPALMIGDSFSDYSLYNEGLVNNFILYTEHFKCPELMMLDVVQAKNVLELKQRLQDASFLPKT